MTMQEIIARNKRVGGHWFGKEEMEFFSTQLYPETVRLGVYQGKVVDFFITSDQYRATDFGKSCGDTDGPRMFSIRICQYGSKEGKIDTVGKHMGYSTLEEAVDVMQQLIQDGGTVSL